MSKSKTKEDEESKMPAAALFESNNSVNDILRDAALQSVVSIELNSLGGLTSTMDNDSSTEAAAAAPPKPTGGRVTRSSSSSSGAFIQKMLATLGGGAKKSSDNTTMGAAPTAATLLASAASAVSSGSATTSASLGKAKPAPPLLTSKPAVDELTSSRNWNNLGNMEDVNVADVFQTHQDQGPAALPAAVNKKPKKKKGKTNWNALMFQGLAADAAAEKPVAVASGAVAEATAATAKGGKKRARGEKAEKMSASKQPPYPPVMKKEAVPTGEKKYFEPVDADVLLGRGGRANNHVGNKKYLEVKDSMQDRYMAADKSVKTAIAQELVDLVNKEWGGRFLKLDPLTNRWYEVDNTTARKKCSQTLREINTAEVRAAKRAKYSK